MRPAAPANDYTTLDISARKIAPYANSCLQKEIAGVSLISTAIPNGRNGLIMRSFLFLTFVFLTLSALTTSLWAQQSVPFCDLFSEKYANKIVSTEAILHIKINGDPSGDFNEFLYAEGCNNLDYFAAADFSRRSDLARLRKLLESANGDEGPFRVRLKIEGMMTISLPPIYGNHSAFRAKFNVKRLDYIEFADTAAKPNLESPAPIISASESLRVIDSELMFAAMTGRKSDVDLEDLGIKTASYSISGKHVSSSEFWNLKRLQGPAVHKIVSMKSHGNRWYVSGTFVGSETHAIRNYVNEYSLGDDQQWRFLATNID